MADLRIPVWTLGDRLRKAREDAQIDIQDMAKRLGYHRNTITAYEGSDRTPKAGLVRAWADICAVSLEWLADGTVDLSDRPVRDLSWNAVEQLDLFSSDALAADVRAGGVLWEFSDRTSVDTLTNAEDEVSSRERQLVA